MTVRQISFEGVPDDRLAPLAGHLALAEERHWTRKTCEESLRQLYATGLYETIEVAGERAGRRAWPSSSGHAAHIYRHGERGRSQGRNVSTRS